MSAKALRDAALARSSIGTFVPAVRVPSVALPRSPALRFALALLTVAAAAAIRTALERRFGVTPPFITFYPAVTLAALAGGIGPGIAATLLAAAYVDYYVFEPHGRIAIARASDLIGLAIFVAMGLLISAFAAAAHRARERERRLSEQALRDSEHRFDTVVDGMDDYAIFMLDVHGNIETWNAGAERIKGWPASEVRGRHFSMFFADDAIRAGTPHDLLRIAAGPGGYRGEAERVRKDGTRFWADLAITARRDAHGNLQGYTKVVRDISERRRATREIVEGRSRLATIVESAMDAMLTIDADQRVVLFNAAAVLMFGVPAEDALGSPLERFIPQRFRGAHAAHIRGFAEAGITSRAMGKLGTLSGLRINGEEFPLEASISQADLGGGKLFTVIIRDITERRRAEQQQSLLLAELAHRVKNTLAVVQSVAVHTRRFAAPEQFLDTFTGRLAALGHAHDLLTRSEWQGAALADVVRFSFEPYDVTGGSAQWTIEGPTLWLAPNEAVTLSLAFHELATNAAKYGALSDGHGTVDVSWTARPADAPTEVVIHWAERGGPPVAVPTRSGFGSRLLDVAVPHELGGRTTLEFLPAGLECWLTFPLSSRVRLQT